MTAKRTDLMTDIIIRRIDSSEPVMVIRDLTRVEADAAMRNVWLYPGQVATRVEHF